MRIILSDFMSIDGVVQAPGGPDEDHDGGFQHGGWSHPYMDPEVMGAAIGRLMDETDALLFGRKTWEGMADAWPGRAGDPFADQMNAAPKHVASRTLRQDDLARWENSTLLPPDDAIGAIGRLRAEGDGVVQSWGNPNLSRQLIEAGLVDEYRLFLEPILLGGGKGLFPSDGVARKLELVEVEQAATGTLVCTYRPVAG
jgi:dihydrofolate reductase